MIVIIYRKVLIDMHLEERRINSKTIFEGKVITLQKDKALLENGKTASREVVRHPGGVTVAAIDSDNTLLLVKQYRYPFAETTLELPAGKLDIDGELPEDAIKRELFEETGSRAKSWKSLGVIYPTPGYCDEIISLYLATDLIFEDERDLDEGEFIDVVRLPLNQAIEMALSGELKDAKTVVTLLKLALLIKNNELTV